ncbi:hypothetical protein [Thermococcus waiotapuensis]|uniref:Uncharacterized protein n=1 Tax=Thermococcus waiotapuensis TaxID=90909 RepID=A0AAE4T2Y3_9EURY|nr:hypothetical protein [Thermococcus waiotapuensis]MDV3104512.1 hypothetical protein [Thermococcus waiotapuensis]
MTAGENIDGLLKGHLSSWKVGKVAELAQRDDGALRGLFKLLHDQDDGIKLRALIALEETLKALPDVKRLFLVREFLDDLLEATKSDRDDISLHALRVLAWLIRNIPLDPETFVKLGHALKDLVKARRNEAVLLEIPPILENMRVLSPDPRVYDVISRLLKSRNPRLRAMGLRLLLNVSTYTGDPSLLKEAFSAAGDMLTGEDVPLADFMLNILLEIAEHPLTEELIDEVARTLTIVKNLAMGKNPELREKARIVAEKLEEAIYNYYKGRPEKAREKINELLINERFYEAVDLALAVGDTYVLKWLADVLEKMGEETLKINERVLPGPRYLSVPPEKKAQRYLTPPSLSQFKTPRKSAPDTALKEPSPGELSEEEKAELKRALESGKTEELIELAKRKPEAVFELTRKLEEGDKLERMDALWALSKLAEKLDPAKTPILRPAVEPLITIAKSRNRWARLRAVKTLAKLASKAPYGEEIVGHFLGEYLSEKGEGALPSLEFFSYYFSDRWDEKTARAVLEKLGDYLNGETLFDALMLLEALVSSISPEELYLVKPFVEKLKEVKKTASPDEQKLALRILEEIAEKSKALVTS